MLADIFLGKAHCSGIIIETSRNLKFANLILSSTFDISLRDWRNIKALKSHRCLITVLGVVASPLTSLHEI
jgi:hypothetical protein